MRFPFSPNLSLLFFPGKNERKHQRLISSSLVAALALLPKKESVFKRDYFAAVGYFRFSGEGGISHFPYIYWSNSVRPGLLWKTVGAHRWSKIEGEKESYHSFTQLQKRTRRSTMLSSSSRTHFISCSLMGLLFSNFIQSLWFLSSVK